MKIITPVEIEELKPRLSNKNKIMMLGSCFADEIGEQLQAQGFNIAVNPFGTLYNARSIYNSVMRLAAVCGIVRSAESPMFTPEDIIERPDGLLVTYSHHSRYGKSYEKSDGQNHEKSNAAKAKTEYLKFINEKLERDAEFFYKADTVILTLGTSYVFKLAGTNFTVSNCHKMPAKNFTREFLPLEECAELLRAITGTFSDKRFILTVSPIRHLADGLHGNQISKSTLLLAVEQALCPTASRIISTVATPTQQSTQLAEPQSNTYYFPAYEIMNDELRDYRWWADDLVHPSAMAVRYIFEKFKAACIDPACYPAMETALKAYKQSLHRSREQE